MHLAAELAQREKNASLEKAYNNEGSKLLEDGKLSEATERFRQALELDPRDTKTEYNLALSLFLQNHTDASIEEFHNLLRTTPDDPDALYYLGLALLAKDR